MSTFEKGNHVQVKKEARANYPEMSTHVGTIVQRISGGAQYKVSAGGTYHWVNGVDLETRQR